MELKILLAIPAYNCEIQIQRVIASLSEKSFIKKIAKIIIINNLSTDQTAEFAKQAIVKHQMTEFAEVFTNTSNLGLGGTHKTAISWCIEQNFSHVFFLHGDDQADTADLEKILLEIENGYEAVLGARFMKSSILSGYRLERIWGNKILNFIYSLLTGVQIYDLGSGLNGFKVSIFNRMNYRQYSDKFTFNMNLLLDLIQNKINYKYVPITWRETDQVSNARNFSVAWQAFKILIKWKLKA